MNKHPDTVGGLNRVLEELDSRYEYDSNGRITNVRGAGISPRFVFARAAEGCIWRFSANLAPDRITAVARLAARESGFAIVGEKPVPPPERLVMIERLLAVEGARAETHHEVLTRDGVGIAELWTIQ